MSRKRKCFDVDHVDYSPPSKKRRISTPSSVSPRRIHGHNTNLYYSTIGASSPHLSEFSCAESSQFSCCISQNSQASHCSRHSQYSQSSQSQSQSQSPPRFAQNIPDVLLHSILSFMTPFELSVCSMINTFYHSQCNIMWKRLTQCTISPKLFPSLIDDDYDSQFEYNPNRHPHRTHFTLNWIIHKLNICAHLQTLNIERTMMNGQMFQILIQNCPNLLTLHLDENPWIFLLGSNTQSLPDNSMDIDEDHNINRIETLYTANLFDDIPSFKLQSFSIQSMYMNMTDITFHRLLSSSTSSLTELILKKRDPFHCSYCHKSSLCKWHKCEDCELRSYCSRQCQSDDWWQHQYVCSYHDPNGVLQRLQTDNRLNGGFLDTICRFRNLVTLDLTWCYIVHHTALNRIGLNCVGLQNIILNGCDVSDEGILALTRNLNHIKKLHCRAARYVTDVALEALATHCSGSLMDLDISRCCLITKQGCLALIRQCNKLEALSMACGIKRGGWIWAMDDVLAQSIISQLKHLKRLEYIYVKVELSSINERKLMKDMVIQRISTDNQTELRNVNGHLSVVNVRQSSRDRNPVLMEHIVNGNVKYSQRFRR
eukprot:133020_1